MAAGIPKQSDCCAPCESPSIVNVPGPQGPAGADGTNGTDGINAFTELTNPFTVPAVGLTDVADVGNSDWAVIGQIVALQGGGNGFEVTAKPSSTEIELENLGYPSNVIAGTIVPPASQLGPSGEKGTDGVSPSPSTLDDLSPTTTRGDILADDGANSPNASLVRLPVGTDGQSLCANALQPTGLDWNTIHPNAADDNAIVRFNGTTGFPVPGQASLMAISDDGSLQSTPTGGNARGSKATDLQVERSAAAQVAAGANSVICGGKNNRALLSNSAVCGGTDNDASGAASFVGGGDTNEALSTNASVGAGTSNSASGAAAFIGGGDTNLTNAANAAICAGQNNQATGPDSFVGGGAGNQATAQSAVVCAGDGNVAAGPYSSIPGGQNARTDKHGQISNAAGAFSTSGDCQATWLNWRISTTDATANVEMFLDGAAQVASIPADTSWGFDILLVGRDDAGVDALWQIKGLIKNNGGTTSLTGSVTQVVLADGTGATWGVSGNVVVDANNGNDSLRIRVTGAAATNIRWHAHARIVELAF